MLSSKNLTIFTGLSLCAREPRAFIIMTPTGVMATLSLVLLAANAGAQSPLFSRGT